MKRISTVLFIFIFSLFFSSQLIAQISITTGNVIAIDFNTFAGTGFAPSPAAGQLDSDEWRVTGLSDGDGIFSGSHTSADFTRGTSTGGVTTGGIYAFEVSTGDFSLGVQPGGTDFTPGTFTLRLVNNTGATLTQINIQYDVYVYNDQTRANSFNFSYSEDDISYTPVGSLDYTSTEVADGSPAWNANLRTTTISGLNISNGGNLYLQWTGDDVSGANSRDEFALDNILISDGDTPLPVELVSFKAIGSDSKVTLNWTTASEIDNQGFIILRANDKEAEYSEVSSYKYNDNLIGAGTSSSQNDYSFVDKTVYNGQTYWYKLVDVDYNGAMVKHGPVSATPQVNAGVQGDGTLPKTFALYQNTPNPFNPSTLITYDIPHNVDGEIEINISIYNILGQKVVELFNGAVDAGTHTASWNGKDQQGNSVPAGVYIYQISSESFNQAKKMMYLK